MNSWNMQAFKILTNSRMSQSQRDSALATAAREAKAQLNNEFSCPSCGYEGPHEDNGLVGHNQAYCCLACGTQFSGGT